MRTVTFIFRKQRYGFAYTGMAMFDIQDVFNEKNTANEEEEKENDFAWLMNNTKETCVAAAEIAEILSEQYAAMRAELGYERPKTLSAQYLKATASVYDWMQVKCAIAQAMTEGLNREIENEDEEIDLGLLELQKKKGENKPVIARYVGAGLRIGLTRRETLLMLPGEFFDLLELRSGGKPKEVD